MGRNRWGFKLFKAEDGVNSVPLPWLSPWQVANIKQLAFLVWIRFLQIQGAEMAQHRCHGEKGSIALGRVGKLTQQAGSAYIPMESQEVQETILDFC